MAKESLDKFNSLYDYMVSQNIRFSSVKSINTGEVRTFQVNVNKKESDKRYIGMQYKQYFTDQRNQEWQIIDIKKNNKYEGLDSILPELYEAGSTGFGNSIHKKPYKYDIEDD